MIWTICNSIRFKVMDGKLFILKRPKQTNKTYYMDSNYPIFKTIYYVYLLSFQFVNVKIEMGIKYKQLMTQCLKKHVTHLSSAFYEQRFPLYIVSICHFIVYQPYLSTQRKFRFLSILSGRC